MAEKAVVKIALFKAPSLSQRTFLLLLALFVAFTLFHANKSWKTFTVLSNARVLGVDSAADLRGNNTLNDLLIEFQVPIERLMPLLGTPLPDNNATLKMIAESRGEDELDLVARIQPLVPQNHESINQEDSTWSVFIDDLLYEGLARYGLPIVLLVVLLGALGLPVPAGPMVSIVGLLAFSGLFDALLAAVGIVFAALVGDLLLFELGRRVDPVWLDKQGPKLGLTEKNRNRIEHLFKRWGSLTLILTRSLVAHVSAVVSLVAGASSLARGQYWANCLIGRLGWLFIYFGFGYFVGGDLAMAGSFLGYLSLSLLGLLLIVVLTDQFRKQNAQSVLK